MLRLLKILLLVLTAHICFGQAPRAISFAPNGTYSKDRGRIEDSILRTPVLNLWYSLYNTQDSAGLIWYWPNQSAFAGKWGTVTRLFASQDWSTLDNVAGKGNTTSHALNFTSGGTDVGNGGNIFNTSENIVFQKRVSGAIVSEIRLLSNNQIALNIGASSQTVLGLSSTASSFNTTLTANQFLSTLGWADFKATSAYSGIGYNVNASGSSYIKRFADYSNMLQPRAFGIDFYADSLIGSAGNTIVWYPTASITTNGVSTPFNISAVGYMASNRFVYVSSPLDTIAFGPRVDANRIEGNNGTFSFLRKNSTTLAPVNMGRVGIGTATPNSDITVNGTVSNVNIATYFGNVTLNNEYYANISNTANCVVTLPNPSTMAGREYVITKVTNNAFTVTITPSSGQIVFGSTYVVPTAGISVRVWTDGVNWWVK